MREPAMAGAQWVDEPDVGGVQARGSPGSGSLTAFPLGVDSGLTLEILWLARFPGRGRFDRPRPGLPSGFHAGFARLVTVDDPAEKHGGLCQIFGGFSDDFVNRDDGYCP